MQVTSDRAKKVVNKDGTFFTKNYQTPGGRIVTLAIGFEAPKPLKDIECQESENGTTIFYTPIRWGTGHYKVNIGYSICVPTDDFKEFIGQNRAISRIVKKDPRHKFITSTISEEVYNLLYNNSFACEGMLNKAYTQFKKEKLPQLKERATQFEVVEKKD